MAGAVDIPQVDVVKVSHHGSADQSAGLYEQLDATVGLVGVGTDNDYGHPTEALLGILAATGTTALRTDLDGLILVAPGDRPGEVDVWTER
jgi:competence protein ComEC